MSFDNAGHYLKNMLDPTKTGLSPAILVAWCFLCHRLSFFLVYVLPLLPLLYYCYIPQKTQHIKLVETWRDTCTTQLNQLRTWYIGHHPPQLFLMGLYGYILWVTLHQFLPTNWIIMGIGIVLLTRDQWFTTVMHQSHVHRLHTWLLPTNTSSSTGQRLVQRALDYQQHYMTSTLNKQQKHHSESFTFTIYENQRRSPLTGNWHPTTLLPLDRAVWTDEYHNPVLPKQQFVLPAPVQILDDGRKVVWTWVWVDPDWQWQGSSDDDGWIYGNMTWTESQSIGFGATRRRAWTRRAILEYTPTVISSPPSVSTTSVPRLTDLSPVSPSSPIPTDYSRRFNENGSQVSVYSQQDESSYHKRSSSRSTRRQAVWKSIVKT
ncbi:integral peroxisomal membrane peroxin-domain-containing protein [Halteromyces radiatus]|uniref:integral peroxisomal membrane peroxin-domain-containing protein n=1 Tax=Halteromyces radiatus TaxID=101107 RepID=UPI00221EF084|nr:integral peroxisomal membrane peroxin-domain-containing protein [Halteromyces radiatus]KAI8089141.1 integral peroxisomal membrane peroxin-domain-containing protein [Halteromyces radiatus]